MDFIIYDNESVECNSLKLFWLELKRINIDVGFISCASGYKQTFILMYPQPFMNECLRNWNNKYQCLFGLSNSYYKRVMV